MHSAFKNLVSNAIKFSPSGATVTVAAQAAGPVVVVEVIDRGPGIPPEEVPHLFTKFFRGSAARQASIAGTGLGLVLARQAVELHHGTITVATQPGKGSRFTVMLPAAAISTAADDTERAVAPLGVPPCGVA
jgi:signal transduction histidine kinase